MLMLTQTSCGLPTAIACCAWEAALPVVVNAATIVNNTVNRIDTLAVVAPPAVAVEGDSFLIKNATSAMLTITGLDALYPGELVTFTYKAGRFVRS
jgi:hypothetical protein